MTDAQNGLRFPRPTPPSIGGSTEIAPGVIWLRMALPYALDHVNLFLFEDGPGWALFDTGIADESSKAVWQNVLADLLGGRPITRLLVSHFHPDHIGLAGWLHDRFAMPFYMSQAEYQFSAALQQAQPDLNDPAETGFYHRAGLDDEQTAQVLLRGLRYLTMTSGLPPGYERLIAGQEIVIGGRVWRVLTGGGHAPEQVMLWCAADRLFFAADQVLAHISPNVSVFSAEPDANPLGLYLASLRDVAASVPDDVLVLPCHNLPFYGLHARIAALGQHHAQRCGLIAQACAGRALTCMDLVPVLFRRALDAHQLSFAVGEALAHLNHMVAEGALTAEADAAGVRHYRSV